MDSDELYKRLSTLTFQLGELDRKVTFLFKHLGVAYLDDRPPPDEVERLIIAGDRIGAIAAYRSEHKAGLVDGKRAVEELAARLGLG